MELLRKITVTLLIAVLYLKMVIEKCFDYIGVEILLIGFVTYAFCLLTIDFRRMQTSILFVAVFGIIAVISPTAINFAILILILYILKDCDIRHIAKLNVIFSISVFVFLAFAIAQGIITDRFVTAADGHTPRYTFGFENPNSLALTTFGMLCNIYFLMAKKYKWLTILILTIVTIAVARHSGSRTFAAVMAFVIVYAIFQRRTAVKPSSHKLVRLFPVVLMTVTFIGAGIIKSFPIVDVFFSFRFSLYNQLITQSSPIQYIVGNPMINTNITIDNSYLQMIFSAGIGGGLLFYYLYNNTLKTLSDHNRYLLPIITGVMLYAMSEAFLINFTTFSNMILWVFIFQNGFAKHKNTVDQ